MVAVADSRFDLGVVLLWFLGRNQRTRHCKQKMNNPFLLSGVRFELVSFGYTLACSIALGHDSDQHSKTQGEGAWLASGADCCHLPLRGKLGWMTPRIRRETKLKIDRAFQTLQVPSW